MPHLIGWLSFIDVGEGNDAAIALGRPRRPQDSSTSEFDSSKAFERAWATFEGPFARILGVKKARLVSADVNFQLSSRLKDAFDEARSARFEFGQGDPRWPG